MQNGNFPFTRFCVTLIKFILALSSQSERIGMLDKDKDQSAMGQAMRNSIHDELFQVVQEDLRMNPASEVPLSGLEKTRLSMNGIEISHGSLENVAGVYKVEYFPADGGRGDERV